MDIGSQPMTRHLCLNSSIKLVCPCTYSSHHFQGGGPTLLACASAGAGNPASSGNRRFSNDSLRKGTYRLHSAKFASRQQTHHPFNRSPHNRHEHTTASTVPADSPFGIDLVQLPQFDSHRANSRKGRVFADLAQERPTGAPVCSSPCSNTRYRERSPQLFSPQYPGSPINPRSWWTERAFAALRGATRRFAEAVEPPRTPRARETESPGEARGRKTVSRSLSGPLSE